MSMPKFPEFDSDITCEYALNMILVSIAMEELALSHLINAEGEKLQYALGTLETSRGNKHSLDEILAVNQSINCLMDSVAQNQMILKNKMDKALCAMEKVCKKEKPPYPPKPPCPPCPPGPPGPIGPPGPAGKCPCKCSAVYKAEEECKVWCAGSVLHWTKTPLCGKCVHVDPCDKTKIIINAKGRFMVSFTVNVKCKSGCNCDAAISLQMINNHQRTDICTVYGDISAGKATTISAGGVIVETSGNHMSDSLLLKLVSHDSLIIESAKLSIIEI